MNYLSPCPVFLGFLFPVQMLGSRRRGWGEQMLADGKLKKLN